jgi:hypothetical protein
MRNSLFLCALYNLTVLTSLLSREKPLLFTTIVTQLELLFSLTS